MFAAKVTKPQTPASTAGKPPQRSTLVAKPRPSGKSGASWDLSRIPPFSPAGVIRPKLAVGRVDDPLERDADRLAGQVMRRTASPRNERSASPAASGEAPASVHHVLRAPGHPLDPATRAFFEPRFGQDFADVRMHDDAPAARSARDIGAAGYAAGRHVVVDTARHHPASVAGQNLLAHELAHVGQQRQGGPVVRRQAAQPAPTGLPDKVPSGTASRDDVQVALTDFLTRVLTDSGKQGIVVSPPIRQALETLAGSDVNARMRIDLFLDTKGLPGKPDEFARQAIAHLPAAIPRSRLDHLDQIPTAEAKDTRPTTVGAAVGAVFDKTIAPLIKVLPISEALRTKIADAARSAVGDGLVGLVDAAMANSPIDDKAKAAIHGAVAAAIKQPTSGRPAQPPTSPYVQSAPPSAAPPTPSAPGQSIQQGPALDIPEGGAQKPAAPVPPTASALEQAIQGVDKNSLVPSEARGKPAAAKFPDAQLFAREVASALDAAQRARQFSAQLTLSGVFREVQDTPALFDAVARIVRVVADALPKHNFQVGQMTVQIEDTNRRRVIQLNQAP